MATQVIVVGGGLAGLSAAHTVLEHGGRVLVLDKNPFLGGNSVKATSGLNGTLTKTQIKAGINDSPEVFYDDTARSARSLVRPDLVRVLTGNSGSAVEWLQTKFNLDLSLVSRLGGHSFPRTHRGKERFPGMTITYALMERLEEISQKEPHRARVISKAVANKLLTDASGAVVGVVFEKDGKQFEERGPVVIATGGYAADFQSNSLLAQYRPDLLGLSTTNGDHCTGDGIKMSMQIGANAIDMKMVQVHPTGLVDPNEPDAKVKFLAAEALRGVGGLLLDARGQRFCDELGHRDYVTGEMWKKKAPFRLVLNSKGAKEIEWHCKHYEGRGLMRHYRNGEDLAKDMGISPADLERTFVEYNQIAASGKCPFGKKYFQNLPFDMKDEFHVSIVTPVVHYCMGGLEVDAESRVIGKAGPITGLYAAGEVAGGVHGENRLGGNSLLDCVVFGRVSGESAARHLFQSILAAPVQPGQNQSVVLSSNSDVQFGASVTQGGVQTRVELDPSQKRFNLQIVWNEAGSNNNVSVQQYVPSSPPASSITSTTSVQPPAEPAPTTSGSGPKEYTLEEIAKHNKENDCWVIINGQVIDATSFLKDHPGGKKPILIYAGRDATAEFNMLHKPDVIEKYAPHTIIGVVKGGNAAAASASHNSAPAQPAQPAPSVAPHSSHVSANGIVARAKAPSTTPSNVESFNSGGTAHVLPEERAKASFNVEKMINYLDGGEAITKRKRWIRSPLKDLNVEDKYFWHSPAEAMKQHVRHFIKVHEAWWDDYIPTRSDVQLMSESSSLQGSLMNHYGLFLPTIATHGNPEQVITWASRAMKMQIVGSYAQTELGHGSNVRGLQTTAEYDKASQEFVMNTPTLQSMKWWPGTLGKIATHAVVYAQLILNGKEHGVHAFMMQIRDENHQPLPGIELGDLGPKLGDHANDTGYMRLRNVRIPRDYLLSKYQSVSPDGEYVVSEAKKKNSKLHYTTMIFTRGSMIKSAGNYLARAVTIATRYSCIRRQGFINSKDTDSYKSEERKIMDYQVQRYRILRQMALAYAIRFAGDWMKKQFNELEGGQEKLGGNSETRTINVDILPDIAATSAGLKALCTFLASQGIEDCRKCCGGNGYLLASGVAAIAADYVWQTTAEGDWIILMLQTARMLVKSLQSAAQGRITEGPLDYLAPLKERGFKLDRVPVPKGQFDDLTFLLNLFKFASLHAVVRVGDDLQSKIGSGLPFDEAWNSCAIDLCNAVRSHCFTFMLSHFIQSAKEAPEESIRRPLTHLCVLFACSNIADDPQWTGLISSDAVAHAKKMIVKVMDLIRPNAVALVDSFDIPDNVLNSVIGREDGNIYEALYESAQKSVLNLKDPFDGYHEYLRPHLDIEFLKNKNVSLSML